MMKKDKALPDIDQLSPEQVDAAFFILCILYSIHKAINELSDNIDRCL